MEKIFIFKDNETNELVYVGKDSFNFVYGHYFSDLHISNACGDSDMKDYENITTILSKEDYKRLCEINKSLGVFGDIGCGLDKDQERFKKGEALALEGKAIINKLDCEANRILLNELLVDQKELLQEQYGLSEEDVDYIFDNYSGDCMGKDVVCAIFKDVEDCGRQEAYSFGYISRNTDFLEQFFDFQGFGESLLDDGCYLELPSGKVACLNY